MNVAGMVASALQTQEGFQTDVVALHRFLFPAWFYPTIPSSDFQSAGFSVFLNNYCERFETLFASTVIRQQPTHHSWVCESHHMLGKLAKGFDEGIDGFLVEIRDDQFVMHRFKNHELLW